MFNLGQIVKLKLILNYWKKCLLQTGKEIFIL
jgi:hypothetical protein